MKISQLTFHDYRVPFRAPFTTSQGVERHRRGTIVRLVMESGTVGYGEAAALPTFGTARLSDINEALRELRPQLIGLDPAAAQELLGERANGVRIAPARFAVDTAILDAQSRSASVSICRFFATEPATSVPINATISQMDIEGAASAAYYAVLAGYEAVKMKVGMSGSPHEEVERVAAVREAMGSAPELRLDVNGSWNVDQAIEMAGRLQQYDIAYLEQPLTATDLEGMARLRTLVDIPIAADEAATSRDAIERIVQLEAADTIIIKPGIVGGLTVARELSELAESAGVRVVVTTALESGIAITAALHLAATLRPPVPACGLATGTLLESDLLIESPEISGGRMRVPQGPGLGVEPVPSVLNL